MNKVVSVIVPVYNVGVYLKECINSIINQTYTYLEIIIINDGSTDESFDICSEFSEKDDRIKLISQANSGVSVARNSGLKLAKGDYVCFVDADDILEKDSIEQRINNIEDFDLILTGHKDVNEKGEIIKSHIFFESKEITEKDMLYYLIKNTEPFGYQGYLWNKLFKNSIIKENNIEFDQSIYYNEDRLFIAEYLMVCKNVKLVPISTYLYRIREGSAMNAIEKIGVTFNTRLLTELDAFEIIKKLVKNNYNTVYIETVKRAFYGDLHWYKNIPDSFKREKAKVKRYMNNNAIIYLFYSNIQIELKQKVKLFISWIFKVEFL